MVKDDPITNIKIEKSRRLIAIGDIHGCIDQLDSLLDQIFALMHKEPMDDQIIFLGDYVDRGSASSEVIERLIELEQSGLPVVYLKGNHEDMMLRYLANGETEQGMAWISNGGSATLKSYGADLPINFDNFEEIDAHIDTVMETIPGEHIEFLARLVLTHEAGRYLFVHAGLMPGVALQDQRASDLIWIRETFLNSEEEFGATIVHGHSQVERPTVLPNRISIDTGAGKGGRLTAALLTTNSVTFVSA